MHTAGPAQLLLRRCQQRFHVSRYLLRREGTNVGGEILVAGVAERGALSSSPVI